MAGNFTDIADGALATPAAFNVPMQELSDAIDAVETIADGKLALTGGTITGNLVVEGTTTLAGMTATTGSFSSTLAVTGVATLSSGIVLGTGSRTITTDSAAAAMRVAGGNGTTVGGNILLRGTGSIEFFNDANQRGVIDGGVLAWGTTVTNGASAGDVVLGNAAIMWGVTAAGTGLRSLIRLNASDEVQVGQDTAALKLSLLDPSSGGLHNKRIIVGAADSHSVGYRTLAIEN